MPAFPFSSTAAPTTGDECTLVDDGLSRNALVQRALGTGLIADRDL